MKLGFSQQIFEKHSNIKFQENPSVRAELFHADGRKDVQIDKTLFRILRTRLMKGYTNVNQQYVFKQSLLCLNQVLYGHGFMYRKKKTQ